MTKREKQVKKLSELREYVYVCENSCKREREREKWDGMKNISNNVTRRTANAEFDEAALRTQRKFINETIAIACCC